WAHFRYTTPADAPPTAFLVPFTLQADWTEGENVRLKIESTAVVVQHGDIDAGDLRVNGRARVLTAPGPVDPSAESYAPTDGFLFASFRLTTALDALTLTLVVTPPGEAARTYTLTSGSRDETDNVNLTLPVAACSSIYVESPDGGRATLRWYPIGAGALQTDPPEGCQGP
ncbi:hypothetical protein, partial [Streptomyces sp. A012304]|uniref:hypothetical protein n=1 Tax=Streptomyces sp. A012304 TaxID=375446 RepID=UPI002231DB9D